MPTFQQPSALWNPLWQTLFRFVVFVCSVVTAIMPHDVLRVKRIEIDAPQIVKREGVKRDAIFSTGSSVYVRSEILNTAQRVTPLILR